MSKKKRKAGLQVVLKAGFSDTYEGGTWDGWYDIKKTLYIMKKKKVIAMYNKDEIISVVQTYKKG